MNDLTIGQRIAEERKKLGLSQEGLGEKTGVSRQAISKWESDAAVPEIDKLITMSKLFGVSVGWLLGVEKETEQPDNDLSDAQLQTIEEIVRRCQPKPEAEQQGMSKVRLFAICLVFVVAALALTILGLQEPETDTENLAGQITSLRQENSQIQARLDEITERLEAMGEGTILTDYTMELMEISRDLETDIDDHEPYLRLTSVRENEPTTFAKLSVTALPQQRQDGDRASLSVFLEGYEIANIPLGWYQSAYRAQFVLPVVDGYEYCFILDREGTQQMQYLKHTGCDQLADMTAPSFTMFEPTDILYDGDTLAIEDLTYSFYLPDFGMEHRWNWEKIDLVLVVNGEEISRIEEGTWRQPDEDGVSPGGVAHILHARFSAQNLQEGDDIRLYIDAELSSGVTAKIWLLSMALVDGKIEYGIIAN